MSADKASGRAVATPVFQRAVAGLLSCVSPVRQRYPLVWGTPRDAFVRNPRRRRSRQNSPLSDPRHRIPLHPAGQFPAATSRGGFRSDRPASIRIEPIPQHHAVIRVYENRASLDYSLGTVVGQASCLSSPATGWKPVLRLDRPCHHWGRNCRWRNNRRPCVHPTYTPFLDSSAGLRYPPDDQSSPSTSTHRHRGQTLKIQFRSCLPAQGQDGHPRTGIAEFRCSAGFCG